MGEPPPATPRTTQKNRGQNTATTTQGDPAGKKAAGITAATKMAAPGSSGTTRPATGGPGKMARERPTQDRPLATASTSGKTHQVGTTHQATTTGSGRSVPTSLAESGAGTRGQNLTRGHRTKAPPPMPPGLRRGSTTGRGPTIRAVKIVQPPGAEIKTVASIMAAGKPIVAATPSEIRQTDARATASSTADETTVVTIPGGRENATAGPSSAPAAAAPPSLATISPPGTAPLILPPPAPPAYIRQEGWISRPGIPLAVPIQLPDGTCISVPMSAIQHNRKWRARTPTRRWILRFASDGRLTMCRKVHEVSAE
ncbi:hypothetical protein PUN28_009831 [Cardiocondyla obscurior]|uniref:Uncharacterized protein n=1 Tax=Cardiocondyla obscurior TaxID=286306 RepID=A0AAW2FPY7_9HYME